MKTLKPCPFCGTVPVLPDGFGTQFEIECDHCCMAICSVQISDLMTIEERVADPFSNERCSYKKTYVDRAMNEAIDRWNTRHNDQE